MPVKIDITGQRFGKLVALNPTSLRIRNYVVWECVCDCGSKTLVVTNNLKFGNIKSCGCLQSSIKDRVGQRFGKLVVIKLIKKEMYGNTLWECLCDCGSKIRVKSKNLSKRSRKSCGCSSHHTPIKNISGKRFGLLVAIKPTNNITEEGSAIWECICDCGKISYPSNKYLQRGEVRSCGCLKTVSHFFANTLINGIDIHLDIRKCIVAFFDLRRVIKRTDYLRKAIKQVN